MQTVFNIYIYVCVRACVYVYIYIYSNITCTSIYTNRYTSMCVCIYAFD